MRRAAVILLGAIGLIGSLSAAVAVEQRKPVVAKPQGAPAATAAAAPVSPEPANTSATYGDWVLRCQRLGEPDKARNFCEVAESLQVANQQGSVAQLALGRLPGETAVHLTVVVAPNVSFPSTVGFSGGGDTAHGAVELQWRRCLAGGCFADLILSDETIKAWRGATEPGKLTFKDAAGREITLPVSFRGLPQALDAMPKS